MRGRHQTLNDARLALVEHYDRTGAEPAFLPENADLWAKAMGATPKQMRAMAKAQQLTSAYLAERLASYRRTVGAHAVDTGRF
jgi:hypothetical protein